MDIKSEIIKILRTAGVVGEIDLTAPPKPEMGDLAFACFNLSKGQKINPVQASAALKEKIKIKNNGAIAKVECFGPYLNFFLNPQYLAAAVLVNKKADKIKIKRQKIMIEFAHPNTHKAFHIGHLRNITTGESVARILDYVGHKVIRANYQGDVGMHIAKALWGLKQLDSKELEIADMDERVKLLGKAYANGSSAYESSEASKQEIIAINDQIYSGDKAIKKLYQETRKWSLDYFAKIYKRVGAKFDRLYFESEAFEEGIKLVKDFLKKKVFEVGEGGAIIFPGEKYGLHSRVFITAKGFPTYEAKDQALARMQFKEYNPDKILHVVAREQTEYFKVIIKALEFTCPKSKGREEHLIYGWVSLKEGKMSSRSGNVVLGEWLLDSVKEEVEKIIHGHDEGSKIDTDTAEKIAVAAVKYAFLRTGVKNDIIFDLKESVSLTGNSGAYLLYILARIKSILRKADKISNKIKIPAEIQPAEKKLLLQVSEFNNVIPIAAQNYDPSQIAQYLFNLAQAFNDFYEKCQVLSATDDIKNFRLGLINKVNQIVEKGLFLLGIETVERM